MVGADRWGLRAGHEHLAGRAAGRAEVGQRVHPGDRAGGRAWARLGAGRETRAALGRVEVLVSPLPMPEQPEHHCRYDPAKSDACTATTLAWIGYPAAERYARQVLAWLESSADGPARAAPGRVGPAGSVAGADSGWPSR